MSDFIEYQEDAQLSGLGFGPAYVLSVVAPIVTFYASFVFFCDSPSSCSLCIWLDKEEYVSFRKGNGF